MKVGDTWERLSGAITLIKRADDFHAEITNDPAFWECGQTEAEAIGKLVITHGSVLTSNMVEDIYEPGQ